MLYRLTFYGGPFDGAVLWAIAPVDIVEFTGGKVYAAEFQGEGALYWLGDGKRGIDLHFRQGQTMRQALAEQRRED